MTDDRFDEADADALLETGLQAAAKALREIDRLRDQRKPVTIEGATIHILRHGYAICGTVQGIPRDWPEGNAWVDMFAFAECNCIPCLHRLCSYLQSLVVEQEGGA